MSENQRGRKSHGKKMYRYLGVDNRSNKSIRYLASGMRGFICTCNFNEKRCIREAYNILNEYSDAQEKNETLTEQMDETMDVDEALAKEVKELQEQSSRGSVRKFQVVETGSNNCIFIKTTVPDPVDLVVRIMKDIETTKNQKCRFLLRMLPIEITCKATMKNMEESFKPLVDKHFSLEGRTFSIIYRARCNNSISREDVINTFAGLVKNAHIENRADLNNPQLAILVEIIKGICCIGVVPNFVNFRKYNLIELAAPKVKTANKNEVCENVSNDKPEGNGEVEKLEADLEVDVPEAKVEIEKANVDQVLEKSEVDENTSLEHTDDVNQV